MTNEEKIEYFRKVYVALRVFGKTEPEIATSAVASLRLLLIDAVGEEKQGELIGLWNNEN